MNLFLNYTGNNNSTFTDILIVDSEKTINNLLKESADIIELRRNFCDRRDLLIKANEVVNDISDIEFYQK